jgi:methionyl-tRNA formyltransferase
LRIIYFGTPGFAVPGLEALLASRHQVIALVSQPDKPKGRGQKLHPTDTKLVAEANGIPVLQPTRLKGDEFLNQVRALEPDLGVVAAYGRILPDALLAIPRLGMINIHASLLPAYRGAAPVHRAVINGDAETGVSIMQVVTALDAGPVFTTAPRPIGPDETTPEVERDLARLGATLVVQVVDELAAGTARATPQDDGRATLAPRIEKHEGAIEWTMPAADIHNRVRGLQPWPLVSAIVDGRRLAIHRTALTDLESTESGGTIVSTDRGDLQVAAGDGRVLRILVLQPAGKRPLDAREFLNGHPLRAGMRFTTPARGAE